jgi:hypothetical protein
MIMPGLTKLSKYEDTPFCSGGGGFLNFRLLQKVMPMENHRATLTASPKIKAESYRLKFST